MMHSIDITILDDNLPFGSRIRGVTRDSLADEAICSRIRAEFEERGMIVFEEMEPSGEMQVALSAVFGPPQDHPLKDVPRVDPDAMPGTIDLKYDSLAEADGRTICGWVPWHFDACYSAHLNRGGVLRAVDIPPSEGLTGFADGVQMYHALPAALRERVADKKVLYHPANSFHQQRFGVPATHRWVNLSDSVLHLLKEVENASRSVHPAIWQRPSGEQVLHVSPWQAAGFHGSESDEGDALLEELCQEMYTVMTPYWHQWRSTDMVIWDNWRFIHCASGYDPAHNRRMQRTTIKGDYGLGAMEQDLTTTV